MYMPKYAKFKIRRAARDYSKVLETDYMDYKQNSFITGHEIANRKSFTTTPRSTLHDISMRSRISKQKALDKKKDKNMLPEIRIYGNENAFKSKKKNLNKNRLNPHVHGFPSYKIPNKIPTSFKVDSETNIWPNLEDSRPTKTPTTETSTILTTPPKTYPEEKYSINIPSYKNEIPNFRSNNFSPYKQASDNPIWSITNMDLQKNMSKFFESFDGDSTLSSQFESDSDLIKENGYSNQRTEKKSDDLGVGSTISNRFLSDSGLMKIDANSESNPSKLANFASFDGGNTLSSPFQSDSGLMKIRGYSNPSTQSYLGTFGDGNAKSRFPPGLDTDKNFWPKEFDQLDNQPKTTYSDKEIRYVNKKTTSLDGDIRSKNGMTLLSNTNEDRNLWPIELGGFIQSFNIQKSKLKNKNVENDKDYFENGKEIDLLPCLEGSNCQKGHEPKTFSDENTSPETNGMFEVSPFEVFTPPPIKCKAILKENCRTTCIEVTVSFCCCPIDQIMYSI
uniref:Uncharacterized protein n=1 Tax=Acrobeloides nanus TaxID=290746 RepID=A0A914DB26_9BILA